MGDSWSYTQMVRKRAKSDPITPETTNGARVRQTSAPSFNASGTAPPPADIGLHIFPDYSGFDCLPEWLATGQRNTVELRTRYWNERELWGYVSTFDDALRWQIARRVAKYCTVGGAATLFRDLWTASQTSTWAERKHIRAMLRQIGEENYHHLFAPEDWDFFRRLPNTIRIYRGARAYNPRGMSWTLDRDLAEFFATDYRPIEGYPGFVMERRVRKSSILFYTNDREEQEIILRSFTAATADRPENAFIGERAA